GWRTRIGSFKFPGCGIPTAPTALTATAASSSSINLAWTASATATSYKVERSPDGSTGWAQIGTSTATSYGDSGLNPDTTYFYRVRASNMTGDSVPSSVASARTELGVSQSPQGNWAGTYGADAYTLLGWSGASDLSFLPQSSLLVDRGSRWQWRTSSTQIRDTKAPDAGGRRATCLYDG